MSIEAARVLHVITSIICKIGSTIDTRNIQLSMTYDLYNVLVVVFFSQIVIRNFKFNLVNDRWGCRF